MCGNETAVNCEIKKVCGCVRAFVYCAIMLLVSSSYNCNAVWSWQYSLVGSV